MDEKKYDIKDRIISYVGGFVMGTIVVTNILLRTETVKYARLIDINKDGQNEIATYQTWGVQALSIKPNGSFVYDKELTKLLEQQKKAQKDSIDKYLK